MFLEFSVKKVAFYRNVSGWRVGELLFQKMRIDDGRKKTKCEVESEVEIRSLKTENNELSFLIENN